MIDVWSSQQEYLNTLAGGETLTFEDTMDLAQSMKAANRNTKELQGTETAVLVSGSNPITIVII